MEFLEYSKLVIVISLLTLFEKNGNKIKKVSNEENF